MKRLGLAVALAGALFAAVPAPPAAADHECKVYAIPPYMTDQKTETVAGGILGECQQVMSYLEVEGNVEVWSSRSASWAFAGYGKESLNNVKRLYGEAQTSCTGMGKNVHYLTTQAKMLGLWGFGLSDRDGPKTSPYWNTFDCAVELKDIMP